MEKGKGLGRRGTNKEWGKDWNWGRKSYRERGWNDAGRSVLGKERIMRKEKSGVGRVKGHWE